MFFFTHLPFFWAGWLPSDPVVCYNYLVVIFYIVNYYSMVIFLKNHLVVIEYKCYRSILAGVIIFTFLIFTFPDTPEMEGDFFC
jgi:hypothetical protein